MRRAPEYADPNRLLCMQGGEQIQLVRDDVEQGGELIGSTSHVLARKSPYGDLSDLQLHAPVDQFIEFVCACSVTGNWPVHSGRARPETIAVEDDGYVLQHRLLKYVAAKSARIGAVNRRKEKAF